jgi:EAL domain-containing protein (putative c-di-GMP-specific phosphodiesterase class I)
MDGARGSVMSSARDRFVLIENLADIAAAYGDGAAGRILAQTIERIESALGSDIFHVELQPWGASVRTQAHSWTPVAAATLEAAVYFSARLPYSLPQGNIVTALAVSPTPPTGEERLALAAHLSVQQYRLAMSAAALAYSCLVNGKLHLIEQPIRGAHDNETTLYNECLSRLEGDGGQIILPSVYIQALEELGLTRAFDRFVIEATVNQLRRRPNAVLGCNVSSQSASLDTWWWTVFPTLVREDGIAERLVLEITETARAKSGAEIAALISYVRATGCRVALDDFGSGFSSIGLARDADFDIIKIDGSYVRKKIADDLSTPLLHLLVELAGAVAAHVIVEGIEDEIDKALAVKSGAGWLQGYHLGVPAMPDNPGRIRADGEMRL